MTTLAPLTPEDALASAAWQMNKNVLDQGGLKGALTLLAPGAMTSPLESAVDRVVYVAQGAVSAAVGPANYMLKTDETLLIAPGKTVSLRNHEAIPAKVLILSLPARRREESSLVTF